MTSRVEMFSARKPIPQRSPMLEQDSRGKNSFPVRSLMSENSLAELRNPHFDKQIYSLTLSEREPEIINHYEADLLRAELFVITVPDNYYGRGTVKLGPRALKESICGLRSPEWYQYYNLTQII
jgi:hypothetical protein